MAQYIKHKLAKGEDGVIDKRDLYLRYENFCQYRNSIHAGFAVKLFGSNNKTDKGA